MDQDRLGVRDAVWAKIAPLLLGKASDSGVAAKDSRLILESVLWQTRMGLPWRDLPEGFERWNSVFQRFCRWVRAEIFDRIFERVSHELAFGHALTDGTIVTAHQKASGAKGSSKPSHRPLAWQPDDQNSRPRRWAR